MVHGVALTWHYLSLQKYFNGLPIDVYGHGEQSRDFTYIDDIVEGVVRAMSIKAIGSEKFNQKAPDPSISSAPYKIYNIGSNNPQPLMKYIEVLENCLGIKAKKNMMPMQLGDVKDTYADVDKLIEDIGYKPQTTIEEGIERFVRWYKKYYKK